MLHQNGSWGTWPVPQPEIKLQETAAHQGLGPPGCHLNWGHFPPPAVKSIDHPSLYTVSWILILTIKCYRTDRASTLPTNNTPMLKTVIGENPFHFGQNLRFKFAII